MRVRLDVNEIDVARMNLGMEASVDIDAIPGKKFTGVVKKMAPASKDSSSATGSSTTGQSSDSVVKFQVEIALKSTDPLLRTGMSAKCSLIAAKADNALILPIEFVVREGSKYFVEIPGDKPTDKPTRREIKAGLTTGSQIQILSGLKEGEKVHRPAFTGPKRKGFMEGGGE